MKRKFSNAWKRSTQPRKQRKYRFKAPNHIKQKFMGSHLSKELRKKYQKRSVGLRKGDKVKVMVGKHKSKTGKIDRVDVRRQTAYITGIDFAKKDGSKIMVKFHPSNLLIIDLNLDDKKRLKKLEGKKAEKTENKNDKKENKSKTAEKK